MERWWSDADRARTVLKCVDGSNVSQGVASALLGLHALNSEALTSLASSTLVDRGTVGVKLRRVDVSPVAAAVARATEPVMGDAAKPYGALVAKAWQREAVQAADQILARWTAQGVAWPTAVQRLSAVVGLPVTAVGGVVAKLQAPAVSELVAKDYGDRALMRYARRVGAREADGVVSKMSASERAEFNREHPRDRLGRFADKPDTPKPASERRMQRRDEVRALRQRRSKQRQSQRQDAPARQEVSWGLLGLLPKKQSAAVEGRQGPPRRLKREVARSARQSRASAQADDAYSMQPASDKDSAYALRQESFMLMPFSDVVSLVAGARNGKFNGAGVREITGHTPVALDGPHVQSEIDNISRMVPDQDLVVVRLDGVAIIDDTNYSVTLADAGEYSLDLDRMFTSPLGDNLSMPMSVRMGLDMDSGFYMSTGSNPARATSQGRPIPMLNAYLTNGSQFQSMTRNLPHDRMQKALSGYELEQFNRMHPRDEDGQFAQKQSASAGPGDTAARERRIKRRNEVRDRRRRIQERAQRQAQTQVVSPAVTETAQNPNTQRAPARADARLVRMGPDRDKYMTRFRQERLQRLSRVYAARDVASEQKLDFANATALLLDDAEFTDLTGWGPDDQPLDADMRGEWDDPIDYLVDSSRMSGTEALHKIVSGSMVSRQRSSTKMMPAQETPQGYETYEEAADAALDYISEWQMDTATTMNWDAAVEPKTDPVSGETLFYPRRVGYEVDELKVLVFGSDAAIASMREYVDTSRLQRIPADSLSQLLSLRADDDALLSLHVSDTIPNPAVRAYRYLDKG